MKKRVLSFFMAIVLILLLAPSAFAVNPWPADDVPSEWAEWYVREAHNRSLVPENLLSRFWEPITRAEFTHLAVYLYETVTDTEITGRVTFIDTDDVNAQKMAYLGVVRGMGGGRFDPYGLLDREQAATMLSRLMEVLDLPELTHEATFADNDYISPWAIEHVGIMQYTGIMGGVGNNRFDPHGRYTIEQSITTMLRVYDEVLLPDYITIAGVRIPTSTTFLMLIGNRGTPIVSRGIQIGSYYAPWIEMDFQLTDRCIRPLRHMVNLEILGVSLHGEGITDLSPLAGLTNLNILWVDGNNLTDITPLAGLTNLITLRLNDNNISDISALSGMTNMEALFAFRNNIGDITPLAGMPDLFFVNLNHNNISDISPLAGLRNLDWLGLNGNPITDWTPVAHVPTVYGRP